MFESDKPKWLQRGLPYLFIAAGMVTVATLQYASSLFSAALLIITGLHALDLRRTQRGVSGERRSEGSSARRDKALPKPSKHDSLQVLLRDDTQATVRLYQMRIASWSFPVTLHIAANGLDGLLMLGEILPDLLISDIRMPAVNGVQIVSTACHLARYDDMRIAVVSGLSHDDIEALGGLPDRVERIEKPIDFERLRKLSLDLWVRKSGR